MICVCVHMSVCMLVCVMHMCVVCECMSCGVCGMYAYKCMSVCGVCVPYVHVSVCLHGVGGHMSM